MKSIIALLQLFLIFQIVFNRNTLTSEINQVLTGISLGAKLVSLTASLPNSMVSGNLLIQQALLSLPPILASGVPLVTLNQSRAIWSKNTKYFAKLQNDGTLAVFSAAGKNGKSTDNLIWSTKNADAGVTTQGARESA